eukprot:15483007-Alexandrium_andersonii.AAC.1
MTFLVSTNPITEVALAARAQLLGRYSAAVARNTAPPCPSWSRPARPTTKVAKESGAGVSAFMARRTCGYRSR